MTYFGSQEKGTLAAFAALFPSITFITFCTVYFSSGTGPTVSYARGLMVMIPAWLLYIGTVMYLVPRLGLLPSLVLGVLLYVGAGYATIKLT